MGFECGFDKVKKLDSNPEKCLYMLHYKDYINNSWATNNFSTFKEYEEYSYKSLYKDFKCKYPDVTYTGEDELENIEFWCSIGRYIDDLIHNDLIEFKPFEQYLIDSSFIDNALIKVQDILSKDKLVPAIATHSFKYTEDGDKLMTLCDGLLVEDEDGNESLLDFEYDNIWIGSRNFDSDRYDALKSFRDTLIKMKNIDLNENYIFYYRSY